jgi:hypothetical protein
MKKILVTAALTAGIVSLASASTCPEANFDGCTGERYSIVETEAIEYWPHNQMEAAHDLYIGRSHQAHRRYRVRHFHVCR